jgi:subfamily B ATP-binding cassette protein MsbA
MKKYSRILRYIGYYKAQVVLYMTLTIVASALSVVSIAMLAPLMSIIFNIKGSESARQSIESSKAGKFVSHLIAQSIDAHGQLYAVGVCCIIVIVATFLKNFFLYLSSYVSVPVRSSIIIRLRNDIFAKVLTLPIGYFSDKKKGDIMSRMTNDIGEIESSIISTMEGLIKDPVLVLSYLAAMIYISPTLSLFLLILLPLTAISIGRISRTLKKQSSASAKRVGEILSILDETLGGLRVVKAFLAESTFREPKSYPLSHQ